MKFGELLYELRTEKRVSLRDLGQAVHLSAVYLSDIERGNRRPPARDVIEGIAEHLQVDGTALHRAAILERDAIELPLNRRSSEEETAAETEAALVLARLWSELDADGLVDFREELRKYMLRRRQMKEGVGGNS